MNYTNPNDPDHIDSPEDWLNSSLIFGRALALLLKEREGVVVDLKGDAKFMPNLSAKKVIVFYKDKMIRVIECEEDLKEGQYVIMHDDYNLN
jgi:hypothetical protein